MDDARGGFLGVSQSNTKPIKKAISSELLRFEPQEEVFLSRIITAD
jgi:hypothetical protein